MSDCSINIDEFIKDLTLLPFPKKAKVDVSLLELAMTHGSYAFDKLLGPLNNNERLEFYGDSVMKLACSKFLYDRFPDKHEGDLSIYRSALVSDMFLVKYADKINLEKYIRISDRIDLKVKRTRDTIKACVFEALLGALFIISGFDYVYKFLKKFFDENIEYVLNNPLKINAKAAFQEFTQGKNKMLPEYVIVNEEGKDHEKVFTVEVKYNGHVVGRGMGKTKKEAEQAAAYVACINYGVVNG